MRSESGQFLLKQPEKKKLILLVSDGEPADIDVRDPQYLRHDTKKAVEELATRGDLLDSIGQLFGPVPGGLSYAVIIVGAILGAITGTVAASVIAMGVISLPVMMRYGYDMRHATGVIAASRSDCFAFLPLSATLTTRSTS